MYTMYTDHNISTECISSEFLISHCSEVCLMNDSVSLFPSTRKFRFDWSQRASRTHSSDPWSLIPALSSIPHSIDTWSHPSNPWYRSSDSGSHPSDARSHPYVPWSHPSDLLLAIWCPIPWILLRPLYIKATNERTLVANINESL